MVMNVLVLCTENAARSILLESILNDAGIGRIQAFSAGSRPAGRVHPHALKLLTEMEMDTSARSKSWDEFADDDAPALDLVITLCGSLEIETCPIWKGTPIRAHWGTDDPASAPKAEWDEAFQTTFEILNRRTQALLDHPFETMETTELEALLKRIGTLT